MKVPDGVSLIKESSGVTGSCIKFNATEGLTSALDSLNG
jgi:hypothetical protein